MKMITAIIQENRLDAVREQLAKAEVFRMTVARVSGHGQQVEKDLYRGQVITPSLIPKVRLDIACNEEFVEPCIQAIIAAARSGNIGDGKIFVMPLEQCIRIRTGDRGGTAI